MDGAESTEVPRPVEHEEPTRPVQGVGDADCVTLKRDLESVQRNVVEAS
jgi:hypothetical protein